MNQEKKIAIACQLFLSDIKARDLVDEYGDPVRLDHGYRFNPTVPDLEMEDIPSHSEKDFKEVEKILSALRDVYCRPENKKRMQNIVLDFVKKVQAFDDDVNRLILELATGEMPESATHTIENLISDTTLEDEFISSLGYYLHPDILPARLAKILEVYKKKIFQKTRHSWTYGEPIDYDNFGEPKLYSVSMDDEYDYDYITAYIYFHNCRLRIEHFVGAAQLSFGTDYRVQLAYNEDLLEYGEDSFSIPAVHISCTFDD